jgi:glycosyltransferase involved in cell wall biosynthesis
MQSLGLQLKVHFIGFQNDTAEYLRQLDIFLLTSSSEGFSIATIEAMASELAVVATPCGGPQEILSEPFTGLLLENFDVNNAAEKIRELCHKPDLRQSLAATGKVFAKKHFSAASMNSAYKEIYSQYI